MLNDNTQLNFPYDLECSENLEKKQSLQSGSNDF
jgi:hypothetical protein